MTKTCFFSCGLSQPEIDHIKQTSGLTHGTLPIRYLGVPLCTRKLSMANCEPLISSVKAKLTSWSAKTLSFAGRLLLINTNLQGPRHLQIIRLLAWQCTLYYIWAERNSRLHRHIFKPPDSIVKQIEATIRSKISALRDRSPQLSSSLFAVWNV
ncbi:hypothetical protein HID58_082561 [Brassica napus]|uniref:Uncharacterized protein n=1 Tax=Brassica napus TaxID=3708 RepID=A0ABQ7YE22_BRANA|nr:hypothetical protein HID58_082561 [Brassica napus]